MAVGVLKRLWLDLYHKEGEAALLRTGVCFGFFNPYVPCPYPYFANNLLYVSFLTFYNLCTPPPLECCSQIGDKEVPFHPSPFLS